ncbi:DNA glycosylase/AP lyase ROS1-like isoform X2 [Rutidosis leptorrhynchoides]|uniref:DNA glycosylase/AP lyase ROS1-like isoform X2 n=1 Tax=Rutidosis leptorrhynchoides TaxID=125765 RepID=UPI003A9A17E6
MFKKRRRLRKKVCIWKFKCLEKPVKKQRVQITEEKVSGDNKGAVKRRNHEKNRWLVTKNHSVTHSHVRTVNGLSDSVSERKNQNVNGAIVKIAPSKKRKEVPKVDLDEESLRVWKLLMENDGSGPVETDKDKEEWWERQREIFRGRVESFLAKMHLIQGNRRFSRWKGSVTDSVVGAFLTQNVSDHLSSSAFMSVAARFPAKWQISRKKNSKSEKKQEKKTHWEQVRKSNCKTGSTKTDENCMDAVDWDAVRRCTIEELANVIAKRGMNNMLAEKIKDFLDRMYKDHGTLDLEWLRYAPPDVAKEFLLSFDRMGLKSVECIRLLTLHHHAFPVDTNVGRVATRLGWVPLQPLPDALRIHLLNAYPMVDTIQKYLYPRLCTLDQRTLYELHYQLITFGKVFCTKIKPNCNACPMKAECRHYASAVAASRPALPGSVSNVTSITPVGSEQNCSMFSMTTSSSGSSDHVKTCDPIIEVPSSPEPEINDTQPIIGDIEDLCVESDDEIPIIQLNVEEFRETLKNTHNISLPEGDEPKALVALYEESTTFRVARAKFITKLRTFHIVYELPDSHPILAGFDKREDDDPSPYLLRVWHPDELPKSLENTENRASNSCNDDQEETFKGTILIPCRTANRGKFPLNGTYFQVNEVFADYETSHFPIDIPSHMLRKLTTRALGCGLSTTSIFKGLSRGDIMHLFWRGSICVRSFNRKTRQADNLHKRLYMSKTKTIIAAENRKSKR